MALFNTPNLLGHIFAPQQFPEGGGGIEGLMTGLSAGSKVGKQYKADRAQWKETGEGQKPNAFSYFAGSGRTPKAMGPGGGPTSPSIEGNDALVRAINDLIEMMRTRN